MRVLAIDTSNLVLSVALLDGERVLGEWTANLKKNHSARLMDCIAALLEEADLAPEALDGIAVAHGPGSYTGVRIGVATAKSMAWALNLPVVGVSSLQAVAMNAAGFAGLIVPLFDARRGQVYTGCYRTRQGMDVEAELPDRVIPLAQWLSCLDAQAAGDPILFLGDDVALHREAIVAHLGNRVQFAPPAFNHPRAAHIGWLGLKRLAEAADPHLLRPQYLQAAEAEVKWLARQRQGEQ